MEGGRGKAKWGQVVKNLFVENYVEHIIKRRWVTVDIQRYIGKIFIVAAQSRTACELIRELITSEQSQLQSVKSYGIHGQDKCYRNAFRIRQ
jgi:hypothetical protein